MPSVSYSGPKLPSALLNQINTGVSRKRSVRNGQQPVGRKAQRKLGRVEKRQKTQQNRPMRRKPNGHVGEADTESSDSEAEDEHPRVDQEQSVPSQTFTQESRKQKRGHRNNLSESPASPEPIRRSKKVVEDDDEIAALEKKLGIKNKKKLPNSFEQDGLDVLLEGLDSSDDNYTDLKRDNKTDDDWLKRKRRKVEDASKSRGQTSHNRNGWDTQRGEDAADSHDSASDSEIEDGSLESMAEDAGTEDSDFGGLESDVPEKQLPRPARENPYVAPTSNNQNEESKYIPPSKRDLPSSDAELTNKLRRQTQGLLNRLSESNTISILNETEKLYQDYPRQYVTTTLIDLLLGLICDRTALMETFLILHAGFMAAVYRVIGVDFGAQVVERIVESLDQHYIEDTSETAGKEAINLLTVLSYLYNFQALGSSIIFDYVREFLKDLSELNTELLLRIVRSSGQQLRQDDPAALKDIVSMLQKTVSNADETRLSVRTKFMVEMIQDLKNNKTRNGPQNSAVMSEHAVKMKKTLGSLNNRPSLKARESLNVSLIDIRDTEKRGKWWLVGASWKGKESNTIVADNPNSHEVINEDEDEELGYESNEIDLMQLAKENRMNTDIRRAVFISIMSASDYKDAHARLLKLNLSRNQEQEIPRILLRCVGMEQRYNRYYTMLAQKLCSEHRSRMTFQFALWDLFKRMGEGDDQATGLDDDQEGYESVEMHAVINYAKLFGHLIATKSHSLSLLKNVDLVCLKPKTKIFVEILLLTILQRCQKKDYNKSSDSFMAAIIDPIHDLPDLAAGLQMFLKSVVSRTDLVNDKEEFRLVRSGCKVMRNAISRSMQGRTVDPVAGFQS